jgi:hypothetical protein
MKPQQIATTLVNHQVILSQDWAKTFRQWLISKGGRCTPQGDVITPKGKLVHFELAKRHSYQLSLQEVAS